MWILLTTILVSAASKRQVQSMLSWSLEGKHTFSIYEQFEPQKIDNFNFNNSNFTTHIHPNIPTILISKCMLFSFIDSARSVFQRQRIYSGFPGKRQRFWEKNWDIFFRQTHQRHLPLITQAKKTKVGKKTIENLMLGKNIIVLCGANFLIFGKLWQKFSKKLIPRFWAQSRTMFRQLTKKLNLFFPKTQAFDNENKLPEDIGTLWESLIGFRIQLAHFCNRT